MATFTTTVADLFEGDFNFDEDKLFEQYDFGLGRNDYPIFDEDYRRPLNLKILKHYWNYEIGQETDAMFRMALNRKMNEIMPYYNQLYVSAQIEFDPLQTMNYTDSGITTNKAASVEESVTDSVSSTNGKSRSVSSTTPQVQLSGNEDYAASAADVNSDTDVTGNSAGNSKQNSDGSGTMERTVKGSQGPASDLLMRYRTTFLNIDMQIIRDLETLFMQVWDNGDEYSNYNFVNWGYGRGFGIL